MCFSIPSPAFSQPRLPSSHCPAKMLSSEQRQELAVQAIAGEVSITELAEQAQVSRKFIYEQKAIAAEALDSAFEPRRTMTTCSFNCQSPKTGCVSSSSEWC